MVFNVLVTLALLVSSTHRRVEQTVGVCRRCGYALTGLPREGRCPECGEGYDSQTLVLHPVRVRRRTPRVIVATLPTAILFCLATNSGLLGYQRVPVYDPPWSTMWYFPPGDWYVRLEPVGDRHMTLVALTIALSPLFGCLERSARPVTKFFAVLGVALILDCARMWAQGWWF